MEGREGSLPFLPSPLFHSRVDKRQVGFVTALDLTYRMEQKIWLLQKLVEWLRHVFPSAVLFSKSLI